jgi:3-phenylpropionate/cinnamic acid dioxygenase small subunit
MNRIELRDSAEELLYREASYLDQKKWKEWLSLYTEDALFWMPAWASEYETITDAELELNLIYLKGRHHLEDRVFRLETGESFASVPMARTAHVVGGVLVEALQGNDLPVSASWIVHSFGLHGGITRGGRYEYLLRQTSEGLRIARKKIVMIDDKLAGPVDFFHV